MLIKKMLLLKVATYSKMIMTKLVDATSFHAKTQPLELKTFCDKRFDVFDLVML